MSSTPAASNVRRTAKHAKSDRGTLRRGQMILLMRPWLQKICWALAWLLALAIVVLSLVPPSYRPITEASHNIEHLAFFLTTGFAFCVAYPDRPFALATGLVIFCGAIELAQRWVPGRHARLSDFIVDAAATCIGLGVTCVAARP
jgi:VanZ family protein